MLNHILLLTNQINEEEVTGLFQSNGKIGVVILVLSTIFLGLMIVLLLMERRIKKLEKKVGE